MAEEGASAPPPNPLAKLRGIVDAFPGQGFAVVDGGHFPDLPAELRRERLFARSWRRVMKNILVIDGAANCAYDIFQLPPESFYMIFIEEGQNIEFIEDLEHARIPRLKSILSDMWKNPVKKDKVTGIHGILFYGLQIKKKYYPNKRDSDLDLVGRAFVTKEI